MVRLTATYRLQLQKDFGFSETRALIPYLARLGISHIYTSPVLTASPGSTHGYDVVDPESVNPELGGEEERQALSRVLQDNGLGYLLDIVPNHMGIGPANRYWEDLLTHGRQSKYADWFDVDWQAGGGGRVTLPLLGDELANVLERGEISLVREGDQVRIKYFDHSFPISPESSRWISDLDSGEQLRRLIEQQHYRLTFWRRGALELNYRRFFDVTGLAALRMENPAVFAALHQRVLEWVAEGSVTGLRIDHIDGLRDPLAYLQRLRGELERRASGHEFPLVVEKILSAGERLREDWPVQGTTGYEFLNELEAIFVDPDGFGVIRDAYLGFCRVPGHRRGFGAIAFGGKLRVLRGALRPDVRRLARLLLPLARHALAGQRVTQGTLSRAVEKFMAFLPVYRTYLDGSAQPPHPDDERFVRQAAARALEDPVVNPELLHFLTQVLAKSNWSDLPARQRNRQLQFIQRFQQTSGPATAKGVEDTALYQYVPLVSLNEVGGDPERPLAQAVERLHCGNANRASRWPRSLICTNTHDTKRTADVRARLDVLSEMPREWLTAVRHWRQLNRVHKGRAGRRVVPDPNTEYLLYQTLVGIWPIDSSEAVSTAPDLEETRARTETYLIKAVREAKQRSTWTDSDRRFEESLKVFVRAVLDRERSQRFLDDLGGLLRRVARPGFWNSLSRVLLHLTSPGVPDLYQGDELWHFALVDPDNRRAVDYRRRTIALSGLSDGILPAGRLRQLLDAPESGCIKLYLTSRLLGVRRLMADLFIEGGYEPIQPAGDLGRHVFAFVRTGSSGPAVAVASRFAYSLTGGSAPVGDVWKDTTLPLPGSTTRWRCALTGSTVWTGSGGSARMSEILATLPVALLLPEGRE